MTEVESNRKWRQEVSHLLLLRFRQTCFHLENIKAKLWFHKYTLEPSERVHVCAHMCMHVCAVTMLGLMLVWQVTAGYWWKT